MAHGREYNFDGLVGPTHNYAGLSFGNVASSSNLRRASNPREAALQGLSKMRALAARGYGQGVLPPQPRPDLSLLRSVGFGGTPAQMLARAAAEAPLILAASWSASPMWTANAATVSPAFDTADGRTHITVANLNNKLHRSREHRHTARTLRAIFADPKRFCIHDALPATPAFADEGAANHTRLCAQHGMRGVEIFVYGRSEFDVTLVAPRRYPARQTREAGEAVARLHGLHPEQVLHVLQNPAAIDQGVFHNDVIAVGSRNVLFYHQDAFADESATLAALQDRLADLQVTFDAIRVDASQVPLRDAVQSYLFNSQLLDMPDGRMLLLVPQECNENRTVARYLEAVVGEGRPIAEMLSFDLRQSMRNGGGPACLRLRIAMSDDDVRRVHSGVWMTEELHARLAQWVTRHYRDRLVPEDLADPQLVLEARTALEELEKILGLPGLYDWAED